MCQAFGGYLNANLLFWGFYWNDRFKCFSREDCQLSTVVIWAILNHRQLLQHPNIILFGLYLFLSNIGALASSKHWQQKKLIPRDNGCGEKKKIEVAYKQPRFPCESHHSHKRLSMLIRQLGCKNWQHSSWELHQEGSEFKIGESTDTSVPQTSKKMVGIFTTETNSLYERLCFSPWAVFFWLLIRVTW